MLAFLSVIHLHYISSCLIVRRLEFIRSYSFFAVILLDYFKKFLSYDERRFLAKPVRRWCLNKAYCLTLIFFDAPAGSYLHDAVPAQYPYIQSGEIKSKQGRA